jgi:protein-export membrane protein SecD
MKKHFRWLIVILLLAGFALWVSLPDTGDLVLDFNGDGDPEFQINVTESLGLDIVGGQRVLLRADLPADAYSEADLQETANNVARRVSGLGLTEATVQVQGDSRILVELPGVTDEEEARRTIQQTALLEFVDFSGVDSGTISLYEGQPVWTTRQAEIERQRQTLQAAETGTEPNDVVDATAEQVEPTDAEVVLDEDTQAALDSMFDLSRALLPRNAERLEPLTRGGEPFETIMTGDGLSAAAAQTDGVNWFIQFELTDQGSQAFGPFTGQHIGQPLAIILDGILISAPTIQAQLDTGGVIQGAFTQEEARQLALQLRSGALPIPLSVESFTKVGATLGQESVELSIKAGVIGVVIVLAFMLLYYRVPGMAADFALLVFILLNLALFKLIPITLTLPAITGFLISIGAAVDGNILIFERLKEELREGKPIGEALDAGFDRAWTSIRDSNISTIIICGILFLFGQTPGASIVSGFAITLGLGLVLNLFTAVIVTRTFLYLLVTAIQDTVTEKRWLLGT